MKWGKALLVGAACAGLAATSAKAADIAPIMPAEPPMAPMSPPAFSWAGPYVGASGHVYWCAGPVICVPPVVYGADIVAGYNAAFGNFVVGAEGQIGVTSSFFGPFFTAEADARAGYALDRVLLYTQAGIGAYLTGGGFYYTFGAGAEVAVTDSVSLFAEFAPFWNFGGGGGTRLRVNAGVNFLFGH